MNEQNYKLDLQLGKWGFTMQGGDPSEAEKTRLIGVLKFFMQKVETEMWVNAQQSPAQLPRTEPRKRGRPLGSKNRQQILFRQCCSKDENEA